MRMPVVVIAAVLLAGCGSSGSPTSSAPPPSTASLAGQGSSASSGPPTPVPAASEPTQTLRYELDHTTSCAALAANFTYISVSAVSVQDGQTYVTYLPAVLHCGGPDDFQYTTASGLHHVYVDADAEVVLIDETDSPTEVASSAGQLPAAFATHHQPIFAIRHSGSGHASALVQRFHP